MSNGNGRTAPARSALLVASRAIDRISRLAGLVAEWLVLAACLISAGNAVVRYLFSYSSNGWLEIQWYMFGALVFLGASYTLRENEHVRVDLVYSSRLRAGAAVDRRRSASSSSSCRSCLCHDLAVLAVLRGAPGRSARCRATPAG